MTNHLGIYGDSYADDSHEIGYPTYLKAGFTKATLAGICGSSAPMAYLNFLKDVDSLTHAVFVYSATYRIPYLPEGFEVYSWHLEGKIDHEFPREAKRMQRALDAYNDMLYNETLNRFLCNSIFRSVNEICEEKNIKLVNIIPFDGYHPTLDEYDTKYAKFPIITSLNWLSMMEGGNPDTYQHRMQNGPICLRPCHLNTPNNKLLEKLIRDLWQVNSASIIDITKVPDINTTEEEWIKWFPTVKYSH